MDQEKHTFLQTIGKLSKFMGTCDAKEDGNCFLINILDNFYSARTSIFMVLVSHQDTSIEKQIILEIQYSSHEQFPWNISQKRI